MFTLTINPKFILLTAICVIIILICILIFFIVISFFIFKFLKSININNVLFYDYNKKTKQFLSTYGDNVITKIYLVRQPLGNMVTFLFNIITFYKYTKFIREAMPYHTLFIVEIKQNNMKKLLLLEKNNSINITDNFYISNCQEIKKINIKKQKQNTLNSILESTQDRIGIQQYFNWSLFTNNCQEFTKECLVTINKYNTTTHDFMFNDNIIKIIKPTDFSLHTLISLCNVYNIFEKYVYDNLCSN
jgi:hypothetical protein